MSGVEVAGVILGVLPIVVSCARQYRQGLEPLDDWIHFQTSFIEFIDEICHQDMMFQRNIRDLLRPMLENEQDLLALVNDIHHPKWSDGSLNDLLDQRLGDQRDHFVYNLGQMRDLVEGLEKLLQIKDGKVCEETEAPT
jgi:hypothetical protein